MTPEETKIARAFVECGRWRWLPGMRMLHPIMGPARVRSTTEQGVWVVKEKNLASGLRAERDGNIPDITDPCTRGGILRLVQDAGGLIFKLSIRPMGCQLVVEWPNGRLDGFRGTFSGVLLQALQAAPEVQPVYPIVATRSNDGREWVRVVTKEGGDE